MIFRQDINGLRAIAVISVVIFHFMPNLLPGGFSGVDVFFVISGYLMTSIIVKGLEKNAFSTFGFYLARAKRIIPALAVLCIALLIYGWIWLLPVDYKDLAKHVASSISFLSNFIYLRESGYFTTGSLEKWLLHTWSLSVEWQFYIVYPLILLAFKKIWGLKKVLEFVSILLIATFAASVSYTYSSPESAYFMFYSRAWEMLAGGLIFLLPGVSANKLQQVLKYSGFALVFFGLFYANDEIPWPGYAALFPVAGTALIIFANAKSFVIDNRVMQWLGKISYSVYLWHWPIVVQLSYLGYSGDYFFASVGILISIVLGYLSYVLIEQYLTRVYPIVTLFRVLLFTLPIALFSVFVYLKDGVISDLRPISKTEKAEFIELYKSKHQNLGEAYWLKCNAYKSLLDTNTTDIAPECITQKGSGGLFLWGDSHAESYSFGLRTSIADSFPFYQVTSAGCKPSFVEPENMKGDLLRACRSSNELAIQKIEALKPDILVVAQEYGHDTVDWELFLSKVEALGVKHLVVIGPLPQWLPSLPSVITKRHWESRERYMIDRGLNREIVATNEKVKRNLVNSRVVFSDVINNLCDSSSGEYSCLVKVGDTGELIAVDYGHLSEEGSLFVVSTILFPQIEQLIK